MPTKWNYERENLFFHQSGEGERKSPKIYKNS